MSWNHFLYFLQVAVFAGGVDTNATETKGTVLIHSAAQVSFSFLQCGISILYSPGC